MDLLVRELDKYWWMLSKFGDWDKRLFWFCCVGCCKAFTIRGEVAGDIDDGTDDEARDDDKEIEDEASWWLVGIIDEDFRWFWSFELRMFLWLFGWLLIEADLDRQLGE